MLIFTVQVCLNRFIVYFGRFTLHFPHLDVEIVPFGDFSVTKRICCGNSSTLFSRSVDMKLLTEVV